MRTAFALYGQRAGLIERTGGRTTLQYVPEFLDSPLATPLSLSMPLSPVTYANRPVESFLKGLLPDNAEVLRRWARKAGVKEGNTLGIVQRFGLDVSGSVIFAPEDELEDALNAPGSQVPASDVDIATQLRRMRQDEAAWQNDSEDEHWSLAGAQSKFTLARQNGQWMFAEGTTPSTHIVKPGIGRIRAQALSEHVTMRAFALSGIPVAETQFLRFEDQEAIVVTRFDRRTDADGNIIRVHQEDLIQAFGLDPARKYESDRGPGVDRISTLLRNHAGQDAVEQFGKAVIANQIIGAPDAHAKNYSVTLIGSSVGLAPLYDVATGLIPNSRGRLQFPKGAMSIGGERGFGDVEASHWEKFAQILRTPTSEVFDWVAELSETLPKNFQQAASETDGPDAEFLAGTVSDFIAQVAQQTKEGLSKSRRVGGRLHNPFISLINQQHAANAPTSSDVSWGA